MYKHFIFLYVLVLLALPVYGQNERVNWHFGPNDAGLHFDLGSSTVNPVYGYYSPYTYAGSSTINNPINGDLMFYTDGKHIVDASHQLMPNANGLNCSDACCMTGLVVPVVGDCNKYYVFNMTTFTSSIPPAQGNLYYNIVDLSLPGNGTVSVPLGDVVSGQKNVFVAPNVAEGIEYAYNPTGNNYWLFVPTFNPPGSTNTIEVYKIDNSGVSFHNSYPIGVSMYDIQGCAYNENFNKLFISSLRESDPCLLLDFDLTTGQFTAVNTIPGTPFGNSNNNYCGILGCEWSADGTKLYIGKLRSYAPVYGAGHIYQYDLNNPTQSPVLIYTPPNASNYNDLVCDLRRGPDNKIYFNYWTQSNPNIYIGCINNPNVAGVSCGVNPTQVVFPTSFGSAWSFPRFVKRPTTSSNHDTTVCAGTPLTLHAQGGTSYQWFGGGVSSIADSIMVSPDTNTVYYLSGAKANCGALMDTFNVNITAPTINAGADQTVCSGDQVTLSASGGTSYSWDNGVSNGIPFTPASGTTIYTVTGTSSTGCTASDQVIITIDNPNINAGADQNICSGDQATLNASGGTSYSWDNGVNNGVPFNPPNGTTTYTVTGTSSAGCTATDQVDITVNPIPNINAGTDQNICSGNQVTLSASGGTSYSWDNGVNNGVPFNPPNGTTTYTVTGTSSVGCAATDQVDVTVNPTPIINAGTDQNICSGDQATLNASGGTSYTWNNGVNNGIPFTPPNGTTTYTVTGTSSAGCTATDQVDIMVNPIPNINAGTDQNICSGDQVTLSASGGTSYSWDNGVNNGVPFNPPSGTTTYTVTGTSSAGCTATDQVDITINPSPIMNAGANQNLCIGDSTILTTNGIGYTSFSWSNGVQNNNYFIPSTTLSYVLTGTGSNGCTDTDTVTVFVNPLPLVYANDTGICIGQAIVLQAYGANTYSWSNGILNGDSFVPDSGSTTLIVVGTDANGCSNSDTITVTASSTPNALLLANPISGTQPLYVHFTNNSTGATTYFWNFGNGNSQVANDLSGFDQTYINQGTYFAILTANNNGCEDTSMITITVEGYGDLSYHIPNVFTPNGDGVNDIFHFNLINAAAIDIEIYNRWGNWMQSIENIQNEKGWNGKTNKGKDAVEGVYFFTYKITDLAGKIIQGQGFVELIRK